MKLGCCIPGGSFMPQGVAEVKKTALTELLNGCGAVTDCGYDYTECTVGLLMKLTPDELEQAKKADLRLEVCNSFIPGHFSIVQHPDGLYEHVEEAMRRMHMLGIQIVVFGSGTARRIPDDMSHEQGMAELEKFLIRCSDIAGTYGITVAIEPLNQKEANSFLTVAEALETVKKLGRDNIRVLADAYHMYCENEPLSNLEDAADYLVHIHIAEPYHRTYPGQEGGEYLIQFAEKLKEIGYSKRVTAECGFDDFIKESALAYSFMKGAF